MTRILALLSAVTAVLLTTGCASMVLPERTQKQVASGVQKYCAFGTYQERAMFRADVNAILASNTPPGLESPTVMVRCPGDPGDECPAPWK